MSAKAIEMQQAAIAADLARQYGIDRERIYFLNNRKPLEYWIPPDQLTVAARAVGGFQSLDERFDRFEEKLNQVFHIATVVDEQGRTFVRSGVATIGERTLAGDDFDEHQLAGGRAISAALTAAGCNPFKGGEQALKPVATFADANEGSGKAPVARQEHNHDMAQIHILASQAGLITRDGGFVDASQYRAWLLENFNITTSVQADQATRAGIINALQRQIRGNQSSLSLEEMAEEAAIESHLRQKNKGE
jgi:hypothetical protein